MLPSIYSARSARQAYDGGYVVNSYMSLQHCSRDRTVRCGDRARAESTFLLRRRNHWNSTLKRKVQQGHIRMPAPQQAADLMAKISSRGAKSGAAKNLGAAPRRAAGPRVAAAAADPAPMAPAATAAGEPARALVHESGAGNSTDSDRLGGTPRRRQLTLVGVRGSHGPPADRAMQRVVTLERAAVCAAAGAAQTPVAPGSRPRGRPGNRPSGKVAWSAAKGPPPPTPPEVPSAPAPASSSTPASELPAKQPPLDLTTQWSDPALVRSRQKHMPGSRRLRSVLA